MKGLSSIVVPVALVVGIAVVSYGVHEQEAKTNPSDVTPACTPAQGIVSASGNVSLASTTGFNQKQVNLIKEAVSIGIKRGFPGREILSLVAAAGQETGVRNLTYGDLDSGGVLQQRPSAGWGTYKQVTDPTYAFNKYLTELKKVKNRSSKSVKELAMAVQKPSEAAYNSPKNNFATWEKRMRGVLGAIVNRPAGKASGAAMVYEECPKSDSSQLSFSKSGWTKPLSYLRIGSPFGPRFHPILHYTRLHNGIDLSSPSGAKIYAMGPGKIITMDKGYNGGAGNYIAIDHGDGYVVKYLHQSRFAEGVHVGDRVRAGTHVGYVGSTGLSTAPHLHLQLNKKGSGVDPVPYLCAHGLKVPGPKGCGAPKYNKY